MRLLFFMLLLTITLSGCGKLHKKKQSPHQELAHIFTLHIEGVECEQCAQDVTRVLKKVPNIIDAEFIIKNNNYEQGHFAITYIHKDQNLEKNIKDAVKKEGFTITKNTL